MSAVGGFVRGLGSNYLSVRCSICGREDTRGFVLRQGEFTCSDRKACAKRVEQVQAPKSEAVA